MNEDPLASIEEMPLELEKSIHVGTIIKDKLAQERRSISWFADQMNCDRSNMYKLLSRAHLDSNFILRASKILEYNFFKDISALLEEAAESGWANIYISWWASGWKNFVKMEIQRLFSNDLQVAKALVARDEQVTRSFF